MSDESIQFNLVEPATDDKIRTIVAFSHYYATGEGVTVSIVIFNCPIDMIKDRDALLVATAQQTENAFGDGSYFALYPDVYDYELLENGQVDSVEEYVYGYIPDRVKDVIKSFKSGLVPGNFQYNEQLHLNYA